jgi:hypothetical protein
MAPTKRQQYEAIKVTPENFNKGKFVFEPAKSNTREGGASWTSSSVYFSLEDKLYHAYFDCPKQICYRLIYKFPMGSETKDVESRTGIQISYFLTSRETVTDPTPEEKFTFKILDTLYEMACRAVDAERENDESAFEPMRVIDKNLPATKLVKPTYIQPKDKYAAKIYSPLMTYKKGSDMQVQCIVVDENASDLNVHDYCTVFDKDSGTKGEFVMYEMAPCFKVTGLYWGQHGKTTYYCSVTIKAARITIGPAINSQKVDRNFLIGAGSSFKFVDPNEKNNGEGEPKKLKSKEVKNSVDSGDEDTKANFNKLKKKIKPKIEVKNSGDSDEEDTKRKVKAKPKIEVKNSGDSDEEDKHKKTKQRKTKTKNNEDSD